MTIEIITKIEACPGGLGAQAGSDSLSLGVPEKLPRDGGIRTWCRGRSRSAPEWGHTLWAEGTRGKA